MKLRKMLSLLLIPLVLSSNSYAAYINHHYGEKAEEKFVSEYMNSNTVVACFVENGGQFDCCERTGSNF